MDFADDASTAPEVYIDKFGFMSETPIDGSPNCHRDNARLEKWQEMLGRWDFMKRSRQQKLKTRTRKGIPDCLRGKIWFDLADCERVRQAAGTELYKLLNVSEEVSPYDGQIRKDVYRTFPKHVYFREEAGQHALYRVLRAYSLHNRCIGYCQGMGFIAGLFLTYMPEDSAFWMLETLMTDFHLQGLYQDGMPGVYRAIYTSQELGLAFLPKTFRHLQEVQLSASLYATNWFMTLFACALHIETVLRIWDCLFLEGPKIIYRVFLGLLKLCEKDLKGQNFEESLQTIKDKAQTVSADELLSAAFSFRLSRGRIEQLEKEFEAMNNPTFLRW